MDRDELVERLRARLSKEGDRLVCAWLFGSRARGGGRPDSDADVAVLLRAEPARSLAGLEFELQDDLTEACGCRVDLAVANAAPPDLLYRIRRDGVVVLDNDPAARIAFEVASRREYIDLLPVLERYRRGREEVA